MKSTLLILFCLLVIQLPAQGGDSLNVEKIGHLSFPFRINDVWAYVDSTGAEWALVGAEDGVSIVDLSNPANPVQAFFLPGDTTAWRDLKTFGNFAYVSNEADDGIRIIDLSDLPNSVNYKDTIYNGLTTTHNLWVDEFGFLYMCGNTQSINEGITILDLNQDPWNPTLAGVYNGNYVHDVYVRNNLAYAAEFSAGQLAILDVSDKSNITVVGVKTYINPATHSTWLDSSGTVCFTADESPFGYIYSWDVSDPANIQPLDGIRSNIGAGTPTLPHNVTYHDGFLINSYYLDGLQIVDAHRPNNLVEVGHYDTNPLSGLPLFDGNWGVYPYLPSGVILATDITEGLFVFSFNGRRASYLEGQATNSATTFPVVNVKVEILNTNAEELTATTGNYTSGIPDSGMYTVQASKFGYFTEDTTLLLSPGQVAVWNPQMTRIPGPGLTIRVEDSISGLPIPGVLIKADTIGIVTSYTSNANGEVIDADFLAGSYEFIFVKWGHVFKSMVVAIDSLNNNLVIKLAPGYYDNFAEDLGWTTSGNATEGHWVREVPVATFYQQQLANPDFDVQDDWGDECYVTGNGNGNAEYDDVDFGAVVLSSPMMDLSGYNNPWMYFDWWFNGINQGQGGSFKDSLKVEIDNGNVRKTVMAIRDRSNDFWTRSYIRMTDFLQPTSTVQFHFHISDNFGPNIVEGGFDLFRVEDQTTATLPPSLTDDVRLQAFPNPSGGNFSIRYDLGAVENGDFRLLDLKGREVRQMTLDKVSGTIQFTDELPQGMYIGVLESQGQRLKTVKVLRY